MSITAEQRDAWPFVDNTANVVVVKWEDSCIQNDQSDDLPSPSVIESAGWLAEETETHVVIVRDCHLCSDQFRWRGAVAIPRSAVQSVVTVCGPATGQKQ